MNELNWKKLCEPRIKRESVDRNDEIQSHGCDWVFIPKSETTELDRLCLRVYESMFNYLDTGLQRVLENLYTKGGLAVWVN